MIRAPLKRGVLVVRAPHQADQTLKGIASLGFEPYHIPLHDIIFNTYDAPRTPPTALIVTSAHALEAAVLMDKHIPLFIVGRATATLAQAMGFTALHVADDVAGLETVIAAHTVPSGDHLHYMRGDSITRDLKSIFEERGYLVSEQRVYSALYAQAMPPVLAVLLREDKVSVVLFFSAQSAQNFCKLARGASLERECTKLYAIVMSPKVGEACSLLPWRDIIVSYTPNLEGMLECLTTLA